jgi:ribulose-5-phosphate 4-epimerase/fuculose-1-phosphate aldolase
MTGLLVSAPSTEQLWEQKLELATAFRAASLHGFNEGIDNHFSAVVHGTDDRFLLNRYGPDWSEMTGNDLLTIDLEGQLINGIGHWERTAFVIHRAVHRARPDARCVFHTHMPYATALSMTEIGLQTRSHQNAMLFHERVARLSYDGLASAEAEGERIATAVSEGITLVMLDNHGVLVVGSSVPDAWQKLYFLERACQVQILAQSTGSPLILAPSSVAERTARHWSAASGAEAQFAALRRAVDRLSPGWADSAPAV